MRQQKAKRPILLVPPTKRPDGVVVGHDLTDAEFEVLDAGTPKHPDGRYDELAAAVRMLTQELTPANEAWLAKNFQENCPAGTDVEWAFDNFLKGVASIRWQLTRLAAAAHGRTRVWIDEDGNTRIRNQAPAESGGGELASASEIEKVFFAGDGASDEFVEAQALDAPGVVSMRTDNLNDWWAEQLSRMDEQDRARGRRLAEGGDRG